MTDLAYPWEGPLTYVRQRVTRGSAAGAHYTDVHILAGLARSGNDVARCGLTFKESVRSKQPRSAPGLRGEALPVCPKCASTQP